MKEYIERAVAIERARNELDLINKSHWSADEIVDFLKRLPAADVVEVRHAYWIRNEYYREVGWSFTQTVFRYECSDCHGEADSKSTYCPHCGAKMDGGGE